MAKPTLYTPEVAKTILERIANGEPLNWICRDEGMPNPRTVRDWKNQKPDFKQAYADARDVGFDVIAHRARLTMRGKKEEDGGESTGDVVRDKAIAEFDLKLLAKWDPRYAERMQHDHRGRISLEQLVADSHKQDEPAE